MSHKQGEAEAMRLINLKKDLFREFTDITRHDRDRQWSWQAVTNPISPVLGLHLTLYPKPTEPSRLTPTAPPPRPRPAMKGEGEFCRFIKFSFRIHNIKKLI